MYNGTHHQVTLMNMKDGSVEGHAAGCADLKRGVAKYAEPSQAEYLWDVQTKHDAWVEYNADFLYQGPEEGQYEITWLPCAKHIEQGLEDTYEAWEAQQQLAEAAPVVEVEETKTDVTVAVKRGPKWSYIFVNGTQVMEVRTPLLDQVLKTIDFTQI